MVAIFRKVRKLEERVKTLEEDKIKRFDAEPNYMKLDSNLPFPMYGYTSEGITRTLMNYSITKKDYTSLKYISVLEFYSDKEKRDAVFDILTKEEKKNGSIKK